jgi:hypothetical protein
VVLDHDLCDDMTLITFEDGKVVFRDGAVGTEQACCCTPSECEDDEDCPLACPPGKVEVECFGQRFCFEQDCIDFSGGDPCFGVGGPCGPFGGNPADTQQCCADGECGSCCDYTPCECPDGRVPVQNGPAQGEPGFLGCCPPEYPFDFFGECCNGQDPNAEDFDCFGGIGPTQECPEGCICQEGLEAYIDAGMDPDYVGVSVCIPLDNPLP